MGVAQRRINAREIYLEVKMPKQKLNIVAADTGAIGRVEERVRVVFMYHTPCHLFILFFLCSWHTHIAVSVVYYYSPSS